MIFVHIPKTGGTSIIEGYLRYCKMRRINYRHAPISWLENPSAYRGYYIFALVRNPYTRLASRYRFQRMHKPFDLSFYQFIRASNYVHLEQWKFIDHPTLWVDRYQYEYIDELERYLTMLMRKPGHRIKSEKTHYYGEYDWREIVDRDGIEYINEKCIKDFEKLGYERQTYDDIQEEGALIGSIDKKI